MARAFKKLAAASASGLHLCVGLDPTKKEVGWLLGVTPEIASESFYSWAHKLAVATAPCAAAYKANLAFWADQPKKLKDLFGYLKRHLPEVTLILDGKFGDIDNTSDAWAEFALEVGADAVTISPYMGPIDVTASFIREGIDCFVTVRTSNPGSGELQNLRVRLYEPTDTLAQATGYKVLELGQGFMIGATDSSCVHSFSREFPDSPFLIPGIGKQKGDLERVVTSMRKHMAPWIVNVDRGISSVGNRGDGLSDKWMKRVAAAARTYSQQLRGI